MKIKFVALIGVLLPIALTVAWPIASQSQCSCEDPTKLATFNLYQSNVNPFREQRLDETITYLSQNTSQFDILCLTGVYGETRRAVANSLEAEYPFSFFSTRTLPSTCTNVSCSVTEQEALISCAKVHGCESSSVLWTDCLRENCMEQLTNSSECHTCVSDTSNSNEEFVDMWQRCAGLTKSESGDTAGLYSSCDYLNGGNLGLLILSKHKIIKTDSHFYNATPLDAWGVIYARIEAPLGNVDAYCTQFVGPVPASKQSVFQNERNEQALELVQWVSDTANQISNTTQMVVVMGDIENGITFGNETNNENAYKDIIDSGYADSYLLRTVTNKPSLINCKTGETSPSNNGICVHETDLRNALNCTLCSTNKLARLEGVNENRIVDFIFIEQESTVCVANAAIFGRGDKVTINNTEVAVKRWNTVTVPLSNHYGVQSWVCAADSAIGSTRFITDEAGVVETPTTPATTGISFGGTTGFVPEPISTSSSVATGGSTILAASSALVLVLFAIASLL